LENISGAAVLGERPIRSRPFFIVTAVDPVDILANPKSQIIPECFDFILTLTKLKNNISINNNNQKKKKRKSKSKGKKKKKGKTKNLEADIYQKKV